jgi:hypothetical protein
VRDLLCDFCSEPHVAWRYPTQNFLAYVVAGIVGQSVGDWVACRACHTLIEVGDRAGLLDRSLRTLFDKHPEMRPAEPEIRHHMAHFHGMFFANKTGAALPVV